MFNNQEHFTGGYIWVIIALPAYICAITVCHLMAYKIEANERLRELANTDALTKLSNRRSGFKEIEKHHSLIKRGKITGAVIMADIDHFKNVNDKYGHHVGDITITHFAHIITAQLRDYDVSCRYGGEEFLIFLPETSIGEAQNVAERMRQSFAESAINCEHEVINASASFGVHAWDASQSIIDNIDKADQALYCAKQNGRNRVEISESLVNLSLTSCEKTS